MITKIQAPLFFVFEMTAETKGPHILNEYEFRTLQLEICKGEKPYTEFRYVADDGELTTFNPDGTIPKQLQGLRFADYISFEMYRYNRYMGKQEV
jgi:hypothetical protein